jgi:SpoIID/LytB domain protein
MTVVNIINTEEYLYGVLPAEMPATWPEEALRAQAIAARSYSLALLGEFADRGFDLYGSPRSMAYHGAGAETKTTTQAVDDTRGMILKGGGVPLKAYFSANHGGYSEDSRTMWGYDAYMAAVPDMLLPERGGRLPLDELDAWIHEAPFSFSSVNRFYYASSYRWEKWVAAGEIRRRLPDDPGEIRRVVSRGRGISGRVYELEVEGDTKSVFVRGDAIWAAMGALRSSLFTIGYKFDKAGNVEYVIFRGAGHGHGIGLDQHGAAGMASAGYSAGEILRHYYPRAELTGR